MRPEISFIFVGKKLQQLSHFVKERRTSRQGRHTQYIIQFSYLFYSTVYSEKLDLSPSLFSSFDITFDVFVDAIISDSLHPNSLHLQAEGDVVQEKFRANYYKETCIQFVMACTFYRTFPSRGRFVGCTENPDTS
jgi:hypothetical protein